MDHCMLRGNGRQMQISAITGQIPFIGRKKRQQDVFWNLAQDHTRFLYNAAFRYAGNRYDAEDLVQETLYTGYSKFHQLRDDRKFKSWMFMILRNQFLKWQRKKAPVQVDDFETGIDYLSQLESVPSPLNAASVYEKKSKDKRASLFVINQTDLAVPFTKNRKYIIKEGDTRITLWEEFGMVYAMVV